MLQDGRTRRDPVYLHGGSLSAATASWTLKRLLFIRWMFLHTFSHLAIQIRLRPTVQFWGNCLPYSGESHKTSLGGPHFASYFASCPALMSPTYSPHRTKLAGALEYFSRHSSSSGLKGLLHARPWENIWAAPVRRGCATR